MNKTIIAVVGLAIIGVILAIFLATPALQKPEEEITPKESPLLKKGDLVSINFNLSLVNGTVADTNNPELAEQYNLKNYVKGPYTFILGQSEKVKGFDEAIMTMKQGEWAEKAIPPSEEEMVLNISRTKQTDRFIFLPIKQKIPIKAYSELYGKEPAIGDEVTSGVGFKMKVLNMTENSVAAEIIAKEGEEYVLPNTQWPSRIVNITPEDILLYQKPEENQTVDAPFGNATITLTGSKMQFHYNPELNKIFNKSIDAGNGVSIPAQFQVIDVSENEFTIKRYGLLTDKYLSLQVEILNSTSGVKDIKESKIKTI